MSWATGSAAKSSAGVWSRFCLLSACAVNDSLGNSPNWGFIERRLRHNYSRVPDSKVPGKVNKIGEQALMRNSRGNSPTLLRIYLRRMCFCHHFRQ